ncbi:DNA polymerase I [Carboxydochorda subterranea]|uniref:DNA polymerase I n=1 Tax=Carboxydichorda subterranea TaxID=3109565 RepID=A0ABZ1BVT6_9FIRM|nr:DNA polymerase I [Limnochorda sp. L945t]WRP16252.1 DNA polymerase I [Limnochorda sp. L945t]
MGETARRLMLVDGYSLLHRAFFALPMLTTSGGEPTSAVLGFATMLVRLLEEERPDHVIVAQDMAGPTFRHRQFEAYKAQRPSMPDPLRHQVVRFEQLVEAFRIPRVGVEGFEADDVIGTLTRQALEQDPTCQVLIVTGDRDILQLVGDRVTALITRRGISEMERFTPEHVRQVLGIAPAQVADLKGLVGDTSDNIPGVPGIGEKTASQLLQQYPDLESILRHVDELPGRVARALERFGDQARLSRHLATIVTTVPVELDWESCRRREPDADRLASLLLELEFSRLLARLGQMYPAVAEAARRGAGAGGKAGESPNGPTAEEQGEQGGQAAAPGQDGMAAGEGAAARGAARVSRGRRQSGEGGDGESGSTGRGHPAERRVADGRAPFGLPELLDRPEALAQAVERLRRAGPAAVLVVPASTDPMRAPAVAVAAANEGAALLVAAAGESWPAELAPLARWLEDPQAPKWCHDAKTAAVALGSRGVALRGVVEDVMLASYLLRAGQGNHTLEEIALRFLGRMVEAGAGVEPRKGGGARQPPDGAVQQAPVPELLVAAVQGQTRDLAQTVRQFARERLEAIYLLAGPLARWVEEDGLERVYREIEMPLWPVLAEMEQVGVKIDTEALARLGETLGREIEATAEAIYRLAGESFNINSPRQLSHILFDKLELPVVKETKTGPSTSADVLEQLADQHEIVRKILDYRQLVKLKGTYVDPMPALVHPRTGRLHTTFHQAVTATGRLSSSNPNLQNIPVRTDQGAVIREAFVAGMPGWVLMSADYSQIELRVLAHMAGDEVLIDAFRSGQDIHTRTASEVFGVPMDAVTPAMRSGAKAINFGIVYGISAYGLARGTGLSQEDARRYIDGYFHKYAGVKAYLDRTVQEARRLGYVTTLFGRRRYLPELHSRQYAQRAFAERMAMNTPIQGTAADIMKLAMVAVHRALEEEGLAARMVLQVHDELVLEVPQDEVERAGELVRSTMENVVHLSVPLVVDVKSGRNWRECK